MSCLLSPSHHDLVMEGSHHFLPGQPPHAWSSCFQSYLSATQSLPSSQGYVRSSSLLRAFKHLPRARASNPFALAFLVSWDLAPVNSFSTILDHSPLLICSSLAGLFVSGVGLVVRPPQGMIVHEYLEYSSSCNIHPGLCVTTSFLASRSFLPKHLLREVVSERPTQSPFPWPALLNTHLISSVALTIICTYFIH